MNDETLPQDNTDAKSYAAPYAANMVSFGSKTAVAKAALFGALALGGAASMTSCQDRIEVNVDVSGLIKAQQDFMAYLQQRQDATDALINMFMTKFDTLISDVKNGFKTLDQAYKEIAVYMAGIQANQNIIIANLQANGMSLEEANAYLRQLIADIQSGKIDAKAGFNELMALLKNIDANVAGIYSEFVKLNQQVADMKTEMSDYAKQIINNQTTMNQTFVAGITDLSEKLSEMSAKESAIYFAIMKLNCDNNKRLEYIAQQIGIKADQLAAIIEKHGYSLEEAMNMNASQITAILQQDVNANNNIYNALLTLINKYNNGDMDAQAFAQAVLSELNKINGSLDDIKASLDEIKAEIRNLTTTVKNEDAQIKSLLARLLREGKITNAQLSEINQRLEGQKGNLARIENLIAQLLAEYQNNPNSVTKEDLAELISWLNLQQELRTDEILEAAQQGLANQKTIIALMSKLVQYASQYPDYAAQLEAIYNKLVDIQNDNNKSEAQRAQDLANVQAELDAILDKLGDIEQQLAAMFKEMGAQTTLLNTIANKLFGKLDDLKALLQQGNATLSSINTESQLTNSYLSQLKAQFNAIQNQIANIEAKMGRSLTADELEELWQKHDAANFANYKAFLQTLHAEDMDAAQEMLDGIDKNNKLLQEILDAIKALPADLQARALVILEGWDPCCCDNCNDNIHEGIIDLINEDGSAAPALRAAHRAQAKGGRI